MRSRRRPRTPELILIDIAGMSRDTYGCFSPGILLTSVHGPRALNRPPPSWPARRGRKKPRGGREALLKSSSGGILVTGIIANSKPVHVIFVIRKKTCFSALISRLQHDSVLHWLPLNCLMNFPSRPSHSCCNGLPKPNPE